MIRTILLAIVILGCSGTLAAQTQLEDNTDDQLWPDVTLSLRLHPTTSLNFFGTARPSLHLHQFIGEQLGIGINSRVHKNLVIAAWYRAVWSQPDKTRHTFEHRFFVDISPRIPLSHKFTIVDRNRTERRNIDGKVSWRYRNRPQLEWALKVHDRQITPYVATEFYIDTRYKEWNRKQFFSGARLPVNQHVTFDCFYMHNWDSRARPGYWNVIGLQTRLEF